MDKDELTRILELHNKWLRGETDGLSADLRWANLSEADLSKADLSEADLSKANLSKANLSGADLSKADLSEADLSKANLRWADLSEADLRWADLSEANLSEAKGLLDPVDYLAPLERVEGGIIVYKSFNTHYRAPKQWDIKPGSVLTEVVNPDRTIDCACGVNVATLKWCKENTSTDIWKCLIRWEWLAGVVVPYHTNGKIRASRVELLENIGRGNQEGEGC